MSVFIVFAVCCPFQVLNAIIRFVAVNVIDLRLVVKIWNESFGYETMNLENFAVTVLVKCYIHIAFIISSGLEQFFVSEVKTFNASEVGDLVKSFLTADVAPNFVRQVAITLNNHLFQCVEPIKELFHKFLRRR